VLDAQAQKSAGGGGGVTLWQGLFAQTEETVGENSLRCPCKRMSGGCRQLTGSALRSAENGARWPCSLLFVAPRTKTPSRVARSIATNRLAADVSSRQFGGRYFNRQCASSPDHRPLKPAGLGRAAFDASDRARFSDLRACGKQRSSPRARDIRGFKNSRTTAVDHSATRAMSCAAPTCILYSFLCGRSVVVCNSAPVVLRSSNASRCRHLL